MILPIGIIAYSGRRAQRPPTVADQGYAYFLEPPYARSSQNKSSGTYGEKL
jgi:hypothetical protein